MAANVANVLEQFPSARQNNDNSMNALLSNFQDHTSRQQQQVDVDSTAPVASTDGAGSKLQGLDDLVARITSDDPVVRGLTRGIELGSLGLNLNAAESVKCLPFGFVKQLIRCLQTTV